MKLYWAALIPASKLPSILLKAHDDYGIWPFNRIPRWFDAFLPEPKGTQPLQLAGTNPLTHHQDVPEFGTWCLSWPFCFAWRLDNGLTYRMGLRYDYVDDYWVLDWTLKFIR
jgi:hypothetical protein